MHTPASPRLVGPALTGGWSACFSALFWLAFFASPSTAQIAPLTLAANLPTTQTADLEPAIASAPGGELMVVTSGSGPSFFLEARFFATDGSLVATRPFADDPQFGFTATTTVDNQFLVVWNRGVTFGLDVVAQWFTAGGSPLGTEFVVGSGAGQGILTAPAAACDASGCLVAWDVVGAGTFARRLSLDGVPEGLAFSLVGNSRNRLSLALAEDGRLALGWIGSWLVFATDGFNVYLTNEPVPKAQVFTADGTPVGAELFLVGQEPQFKRILSHTHRISVAWNANDELLAVWDRSVEAEPDRILSRHLSAQGLPLGEIAVVDAGAGVNRPTLGWSAHIERFISAWHRGQANEVAVRVLDPTGELQGPVMVANSGLGPPSGFPIQAFAGTDRLWLGWQSGQAADTKTLHLQPWQVGEPTCSRPFEIPDGSIPCAELLGGRFKAFGSFRRPDGSPTEAPAYPETDRAAFVFFNNIFNPEVAVKMLDGRPVNGNFWFFYGAMSNQEYVLSVYDRETSATRVYYNPPGRLASVGDTAAFPGSAGAAPEASPESSDEERAWTALELAPETVVGKSVSAVCAPSATVLCLQSGRFSVAVDWRVSPTSSGQGQMEPLTDQGGYVTFFNPANIELALKVLDGTAINGHFWVFYASMTNVEFELTVRDLHTGAVYVRRNPPRTLASVADTNAL